MEQGLTPSALVAIVSKTAHRTLLPFTQWAIMPYNSEAICEVFMRCERCHDVIEKGEEKKLHSQILCEDCYMDLLSPLKGCDPWAVYSAKSFTKANGQGPELNPVQQKILDILREEGPTEPKNLSKMLPIKKTDLERELAALRHMEKVKGELRNGKRMIRLM